MKQRLAAIGTIEALPHRVAAFLSREIESGDLNPGSLLPTEQQLRRNSASAATWCARRSRNCAPTAWWRRGKASAPSSWRRNSACRSASSRETLKEGQNMERLFELRCILEAESAALPLSAATRSISTPSRRHWTA